MKIIISAAVSADGYLDDLEPGRLMLSSPEDWVEVHRLRAACDAILVGAGTLRCDNPALVIRDESLRAERVARGVPADITKVTVSRTGDLSPDLRFFTEGAGEKIVFLPEGADAPRHAVLEPISIVVALPQAAADAGMCRTPRPAGDCDTPGEPAGCMPGISAASIVAELSRRGVQTLLVEGGERVLGMFFGEGLVDEFRLAVAPFFVGQPGAPRLVPGGVYPFGTGRDENTKMPRRMVLREVRQLGDMAVMWYLLEDDLKYLRQAIEASRQSPPSPAAYRVGAVVVTPTGHAYSGYTHETAPDNHAEEEAILKALAAGETLRGATIYASMEPCSTRKSKPKSCSELIIEQGFARVVFALREPDHFVADCCGAERLRAAGIRVDIIDDLAPAVREINAHILK